MGNLVLEQCQKRSPTTCDPIQIFHHIVTIQRFIRGFLARRQRMLLSQHKLIMQQERNSLINAGWGKLDSIITPQMLRTPIKVMNYNGCYVGQVLNNLPHGIGRLVMSKQKYCEGEFINGQLKRGKVFDQGVMREGNFKELSIVGRGKEQLVDGSIYEGSFEKGLRNGYGRLVDANGNVQEGQFKEGKQHGDGEYQCVDGRYYNGQWVDGCFEGKGEYVFPGGQKYIGEFKHNKRDGYGVYIQKNGQYQGLWKDGMQHGKGVLVINNKEVPGEWHKGNRL